MSIKVLHIADVHLGIPYKGLPLDIANTRKLEHQQTFRDIISLANEKDVDFLIVAGDLFEHNYGDKNMVDFIIKEFKSLNRAIVIITPGNHDPRLKSSLYNTCQWPENVHIFSSQWQELSVEHLNVSIYGYGFEGYNITDNIVKAFNNNIILNRDKVNIIVFHGSDMSVTAAKESQYAPFELEDIIKIEADYIALGHYHRMRKLADNCYYSGCPEPSGFDEDGEKGVLLADINDNTTAVEFIPLCKRQYHKLDCDITGSKTIYEVADKIKSIINNKDLYKVTLKGFVDPEIIMNDQLILQELEDAFYVSIDNQSLPEYDLDQLVKGNDVVAVFIKEMREMIESSCDDDQMVLVKALYMGLDALIRGEVTLR